MLNIMDSINGGAVKASIGAKRFFANGAGKVKGFFTDEARKLKEDESGMELVQAVLLILFAIVIAVAIWYFLGDAIALWLKSANKTGKKVKDLDDTSIYNKGTDQERQVPKFGT